MYSVERQRPLFLAASDSSISTLGNLSVAVFAIKVILNFMLIGDKSHWGITPLIQRLDHQQNWLSRPSSSVKAKDAIR
jgi:hypothetical protein